MRIYTKSNYKGTADTIEIERWRKTIRLYLPDAYNGKYREHFHREPWLSLEMSEKEALWLAQQLIYTVEHGKVRDREMAESLENWKRKRAQET